MDTYIDMIHINKYGCIHICLYIYIIYIYIINIYYIYMYIYVFWCLCGHVFMQKNCELKKGKPNSERFWPQNAGRVDESILRWTFFKKLFWTQNVRLASTRTTFLRNHGTVKDPSGCLTFCSPCGCLQGVSSLYVKILNYQIQRSNYHLSRIVHSPRLK